MASIIQRYTDYLLADAAWSASPPPLTSYSASDFALLDPAARIRFGTNTATVTATTPTPVTAAIFALPMSNITAPSSSVLSITNGAGLNAPVTIGAKSPGGWFTTAWVDLSTASSAQLTSNQWNFVVSGNSENIIFGAALWLSGPKRELTHPLEKRAREYTTYGRVTLQNEYLNEFVYDLNVRRRAIEGILRTTTVAERAEVLNWMDASHGGARVSLFIRDTTVNDAMLGFANPDAVEETRVTRDASEIRIVMDERSKGQPL